MRKITAALCALPMLALAGSSAEIPQVVVYASRIDATKSSTPSGVQILDSETIRESGARDLPELLQKKANLNVRTLNSNPLQAEISMRGFGEKGYGRVKVILDGVELNNVDMSAPNLTGVSLDAVERIEIIRGPSPVLYGDGAVAGVINIMTGRRDGERKSELSARAGSQNTYGANFRTSGGFEAAAVDYSADYDFGMSDGFRDRSAWRIHNANGAVRKNCENGSYVGVMANYGNSFYEMPGALTYKAWKTGRKNAAYLNDWSRMWNGGAGVDSKLKLAEDQWLYLDGRLSIQHRTANWGDYRYSNEYDLYSAFLSPRYVNEKTVSGKENRFTLGMDFRYDCYEVEDNSGYNSPRYDFGRFRAALFAHDAVCLTDTLSLIAGVRSETIANRWSHYRGINESDDVFSEVDAELGIVWQPQDLLKMYAKVARFHRSPFCDEMNYTVDGNLLEPETGWSADAGVEYALLEECKIFADAYAMLIDDEIFYNPYARDYGGGAWGGYNCNSPGRTRRLGVDAGFEWKRKKTASFSLMYGLSDAEFVDGQYDGKTVPLVPAHRVRAELGVWLGADVEAIGGFRWVAEQHLGGDFGNEHERLCSYALFDFSLRWKPSWAKGWRASFAVDNIFDRDYCDYAGWSDYGGAYYYPACGRSLMFSLGCEF